MNLRRFLKTWKEGDTMTWCGRPFQTQYAATGNNWIAYGCLVSSMISRAEFTLSVKICGITNFMSEVWYGCADPWQWIHLYLRKASLNPIHSYAFCLWSDVIEPWRRIDRLSRCILHWPEPLDKIIRNTGQCCMAIVQTTMESDVTLGSGSWLTNGSKLQYSSEEFVEDLHRFTVADVASQSWYQLGTGPVAVDEVDDFNELS